MLSALLGFGHWALLGLPAFVFVITVVIFFHELGHFLMARAFGISVETFSIGFGPAIVGWSDRKGTRWKVSWIPLGGYVKFLGDMDAASTPDRDRIARLSPSERAGTFAFKPLYQRALVVAAGPAANFVLAILIFAATFMIIGRDIVAPVVDVVQPHSAAAAAGIERGDIIRAINGEKIASFSDLQRIVSISTGRKLTIEVSRKGKKLFVHAVPKTTILKDRFGDTHEMGALGVGNYLNRGEVSHVRYGPWAAFAQAGRQVWEIVSTTLTYLWQMVAGYQSADQLSGPIGIAKLSGQVAEIGFVALVNLAALISVSIGMVNLFPIPILAGPLQRP